jgi:hypothetical protein
MGINGIYFICSCQFLIIIILKKMEDLEKNNENNIPKYRVFREDFFKDGTKTETLLGDNLTKEEADKLDGGAIDNPDDSHSSTTTRVEEISR